MACVHGLTASKEKSPIFGEIWRPVGLVIFKSGEKILSAKVLIDTGADITLILKRVGDYLEFKIKEGEKIYELQGIGEGAVPFVVRRWLV